MRVVCLGEALIDFIATDAVPLSEAKHFVRCLGGAPANVAVGLHCNGISTSLVSRVGRDKLGKQVMIELEKWGLSTACIQIDPEKPTKCTFISHDQTGNRYIEVANRQSADQQIDAQEMREAFHGNVQLLYISGVILIQERGFDLAMESIRIAGEHSAIIAFDPVFDISKSAKPVRKRIVDLLDHVDILKVNNDEYNALVSSFKDHQLPPSLILHTKGSEGALIATRTQQIHVDAIHAPCVDPTGAGDAFLAGFLAALLTDSRYFTKHDQYDVLHLHQWAKAGASNAAKAIQKIGASGGYGNGNSSDLSA